ncbi:MULTISPECIES: carbohydrate-binding domain-containing protein [unclassified Aureimonas]|uniref:carbohydrate-binding domain-containing protein n=1 Tax=unclassified Aureimonas TaxID=2615206 RepID=UPI0006FF6B20|nr:MULTISPECIES: carbohydrate-binding domain-containing protein [unclassified Aureimonas]KQT60679.1 hypothetical protein ASG54_24795 [Aureimonas sp. Leaf460]KQT68808.1 hypothetical protein ASG62_18315 [Aureimonas sp. Leaf427]
MPLQNAVRVSDLIDTMGVATHIDYTDGQYRDIDADIAALKFLGINHVRDAAPNPASDAFGQGHLADAAKAGLKFTFVVQGNVDPEVVVGRLHQFAAAHPGAITGIEGPNEVNNWPVTYRGLTGTAGAQAYQAALFDAVNADPLLKNIPVLGFTDYPVHASDSDWNNIHPYPKNGDQPRDTVVAEAKAQAAIDPGKGFAITEGGYHTSLSADRNGGWEGVDEATQAKLTLNMYMDAAQQGSKITNLYQLLDAYPDHKGGGDQESHFGMFRLDGSAKPVATAIHNFTTILRDAGGSAGGFKAGSLDYSVSGLPSTGHTYLMQKSDASFQIIAWNEPDIWDQAANRAIAAPTSTVTVSLGKTFETVQVFDPLKGTGAIQTLHNVSSVQLGLTDHPLVLQVSGATGVQTPPTVPVTPAPTPTPTPPPTTTPKPVDTTIGTGPDKLVLKISEDAHKGDAQFTISVDGKQVGGVLTAHASHAAKQSDTITVNGNWAPGDHKVTVNFLNDYSEGSTKTDRNLYVDGATYNGKAIAGSEIALKVGGPQNFTLRDTAAPTAPTTPAPSHTTIGTGPDKLVLKISEDAYKGDAQFTISVDGKQIGGVLTAHASHAAKQSDTITVNGNWAPGDHKVTVNFLNDVYDGAAGKDRNLHVDGATYNGKAIAGSEFSLNSSGAKDFTLRDTAEATAPATPATPAPSPSPAGTTIGTGPDKLVLKISEDAYKGDAQFTISVDGKQVGGVMTAHASHADKQSDIVTVNGNWAPGDHKVSINFLNDAYDGTVKTDRNLYVDGATYNGKAIAGSEFSLNSAGAKDFTLRDTAEVSASSVQAATPAGTTIGTGSDKLVLKISEDAYKGDAQFTISVDGKQVGGVMTAHASHAAGQSELITVNGNWASGDHKVSIDFLNDAYDGTAGTDRNLYLDGATYNGVDVSDARLSLMGVGVQSFTLHDDGLA